MGMCAKSFSAFLVVLLKNLTCKFCSCWKMPQKLHVRFSIGQKLDALKLFEVWVVKIDVSSEWRKSIAKSSYVITSPQTAHKKCISWLEKSAIIYATKRGKITWKITKLWEPIFIYSNAHKLRKLVYFPFVNVEGNQ